MPQRTRKDHLNNLILAALNIISLVIAGLLLEYESSKARAPLADWAQTPTGLVLAAAGVIVLGSLTVLAILALIYKKNLYNRPYLWWVTGFNLLVGLTTLVIISRDIGLGTLINFVMFP